MLTIGLLDIDHFKRINDRFGHLVGDEVLQEIGRRLRSALQPGEEAGRYGGEEMLIVLRSAPAAASDRMEALKDLVCGDPFVLEHEAVEVTCSIGVAQAHFSDDWTSLIGRADAALYQAKNGGRDRIVSAPGKEPSDLPPDRVVPRQGTRASISVPLHPREAIRRRPEQAANPIAGSS